MRNFQRKKKQKLRAFELKNLNTGWGLPYEFFHETQYSLFARTSLVGEEKKSD